MKLSISKSELQNALAIVIKGVSTRSTLPVLSGILLEATGDSLVLQATDLELSIQYSTAALVEEEGKAVVPGKLFSDIVKNLPDAAVHVEADEENALIVSIEEAIQEAEFSRASTDIDAYMNVSHSLEGLLGNEKCVKHIKDFVVDERCEENVLFLLDVNEFRKMYNDDNYSQSQVSVSVR